MGEPGPTQINDGKSVLSSVIKQPVAQASTRIGKNSEPLIGARNEAAEWRMQGIRKKLSGFEHSLCSPISRVVTNLENITQSPSRPKDWQKAATADTASDELLAVVKDIKLRLMGLCATFDAEKLCEVAEIGRRLAERIQKLPEEAGLEKEIAETSASRMLKACGGIESFLGQEPEKHDVLKWVNDMVERSEFFSNQFSGYPRVMAKVDKKAEYPVFGLEFDIGIIFDNLSMNAESAVEKLKMEDRWVSISLNKETGFIKIVCKNPAEIDDELAEKIDSQVVFEKGFSTKEKGGGQGLGIIKEAVEGLGGSVRTFVAEPLEGEKGRAFGITVSIPEYAPGAVGGT